MCPLEEMSAFFEARVVGYDAHMMQEVEGCREGYPEMARLVPKTAKRLLDLGCGTGLELDEIFKLLPGLKVTGIDLTKAMLDELKRKHPDKDLTLVCGDYFSVDLGSGIYDCAVSFETMHHFPPEKKLGLYRKIYEALTPSGCYIECDYMVETQAEADFYFAENARFRAEQNIPEDVFCHYDTPCTIENQKQMFLAAGFRQVREIFRIGGTSLLVAEK